MSFEQSGRSVASPYPRNLSYFVKKLSNYSKNTVRLQSLNTTTAGPSQIVTVDLPTNTLVDLSTLVWYFEGATNASTGNCTFPRNIETLIERIEIEVNGQLISPGCANYPHLFQVISDSQMGEDCTNRRGLLQNGFNIDAPTGHVGTITGGAFVSGTPFTICNWLGFLGSCQPQVLDTNILGNVRIRITLASTNVLISSATAAVGATYLLGNMFFSVDALDINDGVYYAIHDQALSRGMVYDIPFNNFYNFTQSITAGGDGSVKFSLSTQSLNHLWATFVYGGTVPQTADTPSNVFTGSTSGAGTSRYFLRSSAGIASYQFNINNTPVPNFRVNPNLAFQLLLNSYNLSQDTLGGVNKNISSLTAWRQKYWVASCSLDHAVSSDERYISGINTLGNNAQCTFDYSGANLTGHMNTHTGSLGATAATINDNPTALVFAQTTAILSVGAGRQISVTL